MKTDDIDLLRRYLGGVPMTVDQREAVNGQLNRLRGQFADMHMRQRREHAERHAEQAIESITEAIGIHNYHEAARHVLEAWETVRQLHDLFPAQRLVETIRGIRDEADEGAYLLRIKRRWRSLPGDRVEAIARRSVIETLRGLLGGLHKSHGTDTPFTDAMRESIKVLEHLLDEIPF